MKTLVTGATGFLGWHVASVLTTRGNHVRALVRRPVDDLQVECVYGDLRDISSLRKALGGIRQVFHVAADYRLWAKNPAEIYESNVVGTRNLIEASREAGIERFIYTSSVATIAPPAAGRVSNENSEARLDQMIGHYKRSKFLAEREVLDAAAGGFPAVVVNPTMPVGPRDLKPTPTGRVIVDFLNGRMPAYVDTGFNVVGVEDVAEGHWLAAQHGRVGQRYILGGRNMTLKEYLDALARVTGIPAPRIRLPRAFALAAGLVENAFCSILKREPRIPLEGVRMAKYKMFVDCSLAASELGFHAGSVEDALSRAADWYARNNFVRHELRGRMASQMPSGEILRSDLAGRANQKR